MRAAVMINQHRRRGVYAALRPRYLAVRRTDGLDLARDRVGRHFVTGFDRPSTWRATSFGFDFGEATAAA